MSELLFALHGYFISPLLTVYFIGVFAYVILGWLMITGVADMNNPTVRQIYGFLHSVIDPVARPIRRIIPPIGRLDLSVLIILLAIPFIRDYAIPRIILLIPF